MVLDAARRHLVRRRSGSPCVTERLGISKPNTTQARQARQATGFIARRKEGVRSRQGLFSRHTFEQPQCYCRYFRGRWRYPILRVRHGIVQSNNMSSAVRVHRCHPLLPRISLEARLQSDCLVASSLSFQVPPRHQHDRLASCVRSRSARVKVEKQLRTVRTADALAS